MPEAYISGALTRAPRQSLSGPPPSVEIRWSDIYPEKLDIYRIYFGRKNCGPEKLEILERLVRLKSYILDSKALYLGKCFEDKRTPIMS